MNSDLESLLSNTFFSKATTQYYKEERKKYFNEEDFKSYEKHRIFTPKQKEECWKLSNMIPGRDPNRWRYDAIGNPVLKALKGCMGPLCHEYDHILPFSKGGETKLSNCQILQTRVNREKSNKINMTDQELKQVSNSVLLNETEMDFVENLVYGNIKKYY